jgi:demethylmenaquinone methyltransferase/2-methoxy-6-polyprenyl-1,4-benzoquinol methylase
LNVTQSRPSHSDAPSGTPRAGDATNLRWSDDLLADPHRAADKADRVEHMFAAIADTYDLNNRVHSLWRDQAWRRAAVRAAGLTGTETVLDVACGTGDLTRAMARGGSDSVIGVDFTFPMLQIAHRKPTPPGEAPIVYVEGDALQLPIADRSVDVVSIAFGIRNVVDPAAALREFHRVLRPGGRCVILEFGLPRSRLLRGIYNIYFRRVMPLTATVISGDRTGAYRYLPESVNTFISRERMTRMLGEAGFEVTQSRSLTLGICLVYSAVRAG